LANCIIVGLGGFLGTLLRYLVTMVKVHDYGFPVKTLFINVAGAFVIGLIATAVIKNLPMNPRLILFLKVGICGGFTTFSTFALETVNLIQNGKITWALAYIVLSVVLSILAVIGGELLIK